MVGHEVVSGEPVQAEWLDEGRRPAGRDELGHRLTTGGNRLEAPRSPTGRDEEAVDAGLAHDRREVGRDVADPGPAAQDP